MTTVELFDDYWTAVSEGDSGGAQAVAEAALDRGVAPVDLLDLVTLAQGRVGDLWADGSWSVPREHAATAVGEHVVSQLADEIREHADGPLLVLACVEREWHSLPTLVLSQQLRHYGCRVVHLGANASRDHLVGAILDEGPRAVLLSASLHSSLPRVRRFIEAVRGTGTPVVVGGRAFDAEGLRARRLGATAHADDAASLVAALATLPHHVDPAPPLRHDAAQEARHLQAVTDDVRRDVVAATQATLGLGPVETLDPDQWDGVLLGFVPHVVEGVVGALLTEDPSTTAETRAWLEDVMAARQAPDGVVEALWDALRQRLRDHPVALAMLG